MSKCAWGLSVVLFGCAPVSMSDQESESVETTSAPIVGGWPDVEHRAVVAISGRNGMCSATIIAKESDVGFALTAAHCCRGNSPSDMAIIVGDDFARPSMSFDVLATTLDRRYDAKNHDFCIVEFTGSIEEIQRLAAVEPMTSAEDDLAPGEVIDFVGYGSTHDYTYNTLRRHITVKLEDVDPRTVEYLQVGNGTCFGDSGGPGLRLVNGDERVAAVISGGGGQCGGVGVAGRVSAVYDDFIAPIVAGHEQRITCGECVTAALSPVGECRSATRACLGDADCKALVGCYDGCETERCREGCTGAHAEAVPMYRAIKACLCQSSCSDECAENAICVAQVASSQRQTQPTQTASPSCKP
jgi:hypothetical protein